MIRQFSAEQIAIVQGADGHTRLPLSVDWISGPGLYAKANVSTWENGYEAVEAIGSRCVGSSALYLPLVDADGGVEQSTYVSKIPGNEPVVKTVIHAAQYGTLRPDDDMFDLLKDYGIALDVTQYSRESPRAYDVSPGNMNEVMVGALVLRSRPGLIETLPSSTAGQAHVYVQAAMSRSEHAILMKGFASAGVTSQMWTMHALEDGYGGTLRTPWTVKAPSNPIS
jgi:hypothetical protein